MSKPMHVIPFQSSRQFQRASLAASGLVMNDEAVVNTNATRLTGDSVFCTNFEDQYLCGADIETTAADVNSSSWCALPSGNLISRKSIVLYNNGSNTVYVLANTAKPISEAFPMPASSSLSFDLLAYRQLWGRTLSGTSNVRILEAS